MSRLLFLLVLLLPGTATAKTDTAQTDTARTDTARTDTAQTNTAQTDTARTDTVTVSIDQAIRRAVSESPDIQAERAKQTFAGARLREARSSRILTEFSATSAHAAAPAISNPNGTPTGQLYLDPEVRNDWEDLTPFNRLDIEAVQPLWTWGQLGGTIRAARFGEDLATASVREQEVAVARRTGELYYSVVLVDALAGLTREARDIVRQAKDEIQRLLDEGASDVDDADLFQVLITEQEFNRRVVEVRERGHTARVALRRQLMLPDGAVVEPEDRFLEPLPTPTDSLFDLQALALATRPEVAQARAGIAARSALVDVARSDFYPKLFLGVNARYSGADGRYRQRNPFVGDPFLSRSLQAGLAVRLDLNPLQTRARVEQARAELSEVQHLETAAEQLVLFEVEEAWRNVRVDQARVEAAEEALRISREWLRTEQINFDLELGDTENLVKAVRANLELQAERHQAVFEYNVSVLSLSAAIGSLRAGLR